jgi:hypothetical protein
MPQSSEIHGKRRKNKEPLGSADVSGRKVRESIGWAPTISLDEIPREVTDVARQEGPVHAAER